MWVYEKRLQIPVDIKKRDLNCLNWTFFKGIFS